MQAPSATLGVSQAVGPHATTWARVGTAFETPTTTELANTPEGDNGFNPDLEPQHATELELGLRVTRGSVQAGLVGFRADVRDELIAFEVPTDPGPATSGMPGARDTRASRWTHGGRAAFRGRARRTR